MFWRMSWPVEVAAALYNISELVRAAHDADKMPRLIEAVLTHNGRVTFHCTVEGVH